MQRMWRQMFAAMAAVLAVAGVASAQSPNSIPNPLPIAPARVIPAPAPAQIAGVPVITIGHHSRGSGCGSCAPAPCAPAPCAPAAAPCPPAPCGTAKNNGCGSAKSDCAFMFGSCKSFFNPCGPGGNGHGHGFGRGGHGGGGIHGRCGGWTFATPYGTGFNHCVYDTFLNH